MSDQTAAVKLSIQGPRAHRWLVRVALPLLFLATSSANAFAQTVATYGFTQGWATFGLALPKGAVTTGVKVGTLQTQTDVKTRWPDGTIRFAVVTARIGSAGNYAITPGPLVASQTGFSAWQREAIVFAFQMGTLILPTVIPAVTWVVTHRQFLERLRGRMEEASR